MTSFVTKQFWKINMYQSLILNRTLITLSISSLVITPLKVESIMKCLPLGKAVGPDGINNRILRECSRELSHPLYFLINHSLSLGIFPETWKDAMVSAIFKKGDMSSVSYYRPISLLSCSERVAVRAVFKHLYNHLHENSILTHLQSGFIPGDSPTNQLTYLYDTFSHALDSGKEIRVVFCDISKAFDCVWHQGILLKLRAAGVTGNLLSWFRSFFQTEDRRSFSQVHLLIGISYLLVCHKGHS